MNLEESTYHWQEPAGDQLGSCVDNFLTLLKQPTWISQAGKDSSRCRMVVTLLHGNEPSGLSAIWRWLKSGETPQVTTHFFIGSVDAAREPPGFALRHFPDARDLNRCFNGPFDDIPGEIAWTLLRLIRSLTPEAVIDMHNTSGSGPSFAVAVSDTPRHAALASLFTERMINTDVRLGALMELTSEHCPIVTIECGGAIDPESERIASEGLQRYLQQKDVLHEPETDWDLEILHRPVRITLQPGCNIAYSEAPCLESDLTLPPDIEHLNFGRVRAGTPLGWLGWRGLASMKATDGHGNDLTAEVFEMRGQRLVAKLGLKLFMITTNPEIAASDCLCYVVIDNSE